MISLIRGRCVSPKSSERQHMTKKKATGGVNRSEFIRNALTKNPDLNLKAVNDLWSRSGGPGEISGVLYYQVRRKMGLKRTEYRWMRDEDQP